MKDKINVAELLRNCPSGMKLDCTTSNSVTFQCVDNDGIWIGYIDSDNNNRVIHLTCYGCIKIKNIETKCIIFPKGKNTWEGFVPPCKFKDGDILYCNANDDGEDKDMFKYIFIFDKMIDGRFYYSHCHLFGNEFYGTKTNLVHDYTVRFATEEEKQRLFDAIKANSYRWNPDNKTLEKLIKPKFKVGDRIRHKENGKILKIVEIAISDSIYCCGLDCVWVADQDKYELVPKSDITTLVPFESKVLVRDYDTQIWIPAFWGKYLEDDSNCRYLTTNGCYKYCIPYEGNKHLLGTTDDCDEYFQIWK